MHSFYFYPQLMCLPYGLYCLILRLPARPFSGSVGEADTPPINLPTLRRGWLLPWDFYFYKVCSPTPCIFSLYGFSVMYDMDTLRVACSCTLNFLWIPALLLSGLLSIVPSFWCFLRGVWSYPRNLMSASARSGFEDPSRFSQRYLSCFRVA